MNHPDDMIDARFVASNGSFRDVPVTEQGERLGSTTTVGAPSKVVGRSIVPALTTVGLVQVAKTEAPQGFLVVNDQMGAQSAKLAADGCLILTLETGETSSIRDGYFGVLTGGPISIAEPNADAALGACTDAVAVTRITRSCCLSAMSAVSACGGTSGVPPRHG